MVFLLTSGTGHLLLTQTEAGPSNCGIMSGMLGLAMELPIILLSREEVHYEKRVLVTPLLCVWSMSILAFSLGGLISTSEVLVSLSINLAPT